MIHDPEIRVECDGCGNSVTITPPRFTKASVQSCGGGEFDCWEPTTVAAIRLLGWICRDGKQFCCERCANKDL